MKNYVISLNTATERRQHIMQEFGSQDVDFQFFDAITPSQIDALAAKFHINIKDANLTAGEKACLLSHVCLWQKCIDDNLDYIAIFEDDIYLGKNANLFLNTSDWIPDECQVIKLEMFDRCVHMSPKSKLRHKERSLRKLNDIHLGAAGYILSKQTCLQLIKFIQSYHQGIIASDHILFEDYLKLNEVYQLSPALIAQSDRLQLSQKTVFSSSLEQDRRMRFDSEVKSLQQRNRLTIPQKVMREIGRVHNQITSLPNKIYMLLFCKLNFK